MSLVVNENDIPKRAREDREHRMQYNVRRTFVGGGILDIIGEGEHTRIWIGRSEKSPCLITLTQEQMRGAMNSFSEAMAGTGKEIQGIE